MELLNEYGQYDTYILSYELRVTSYELKEESLTVTDAWRFAGLTAQACLSVRVRTCLPSPACAFRMQTGHRQAKTGAEGRQGHADRG